MDQEDITFSDELSGYDWRAVLTSYAAYQRRGGREPFQRWNKPGGRNMPRYRIQSTLAALAGSWGRQRGHAGPFIIPWGGGETGCT